jgi:hypothetical protein
MQEKTLDVLTMLKKLQTPMHAQIVKLQSYHTLCADLADITMSV